MEETSASLHKDYLLDLQNPASTSRDLTPLKNGRPLRSTTNKVGYKSKA
jgi:hypothetical protein